MITLGLNAFHGDSAAAIVKDGQLLAAAEEERFRRIKHWAGFPSQAISYCLAEAGVRLADVDHIAVNQNGRANFARKIAYLGRHPAPKLVLQRLRNRGKRKAIPELLERYFVGDRFRGESHEIEHHLCHLYSAYYVSPFAEAAVASIDGFGDFSSAAWASGSNSQISVNGRVYFPHSLGLFYEVLTQYLGFPHYGDEYKVMGLAPYGKPKYLKSMQDIVRVFANGKFEMDLQYFRHHKEDVPYTWDDGAPQVGDKFSPALEDLLGPRRQRDQPLEERHLDIARSVQAMYEEAFFNLLNVLQRQTGMSNIALAGGCAANSVANGKIRRRSPFKNVYVQSAAGDAGGAIGAAYAVWAKLGGERRFVMDHAYWGPAYSEAQIEQLLTEKQNEISAAACIVEYVEDEDRLCRKTADAIAAGQVVGWFQGRMEWGPRALGNRSIVCDPRRADMKAILNAKIKRRESFRPFAPSVLEADVAEWFEEDDDVPFMMQVFQIREEKRAQIPAVTHVDGSGRLQTVHRDSNPRYYRLIESFKEVTGIPMLLNTSFNENEPVVCQPVEALDCFLRTNMDALVLGNHMIRRQGSNEAG